MDTKAVRVIALEKVSSPAYLHAIFAAWRAGDVIAPTDDPATLVLPGMTISERLMIAPGGGWFDETLPLDDDPAPAQISFTSGTTGTPKPVLLSRRALSDVTRRLNEAMQIDSSIREYVGVPVTFSFGLGRVRAIAAVGGKAYLPPNGFRIDELADMLGRGEINALAAVPTLLRILAQQAELFATIGGKLKWLEIGSQYMSAQEKAEIVRIFPKARIVQHYGLTEASRTTFLVVSDTKGAALESVGKPASPGALRINADGRIVLRGPHVADGIMTESGVAALADAEGWLTTNDLGSVDDEGFVYFLGRADHLLNISGIKVPAELFEQRLADAIGADGGNIAVAGRKDALRGEAVLVAYLPGVALAPLQAQARAIAAGFGLGAADVSFVEVPEIPRTDTGKIRRGDITKLYGQAPVPSADSAALDEDLTPREREIAAIWQDALGVSPIGKHESFFDIGGDSLSAIAVMIRMERAGVSKTLTQQIFEGRTIAEIAADMDAGGGAPKRAPAIRAQTTDAINITRGLLVLVVISAHWGPFFFERAGAYAGPLLLHWSNPLFRFGTPSFAIIFGVGLGYFQMPSFARNPERLRSNLRLKSFVIAIGVGLTAILVALQALLVDGGFDQFWPTKVFYSVLLFYLLLSLTVEPVLRLIHRAAYPVLRTLQLMVAAFAVAYLCNVLWAADTWWSIADLVRLMLVAKYAYPEMLGYVLAGLAIGLWIEEHNARPDLSRSTANLGLTLLAGGVLLSFTTDGVHHWFDASTSHPAFMAYVGAVLLVFAGSFQLVRHSGETGAYKLPLRLFAVIGTLSIAAYVGHGMVIVAKDILVALHVPYLVAMIVPLGLFFGGFGVAMRKLYRMYYG